MKSHSLKALALLASLLTVPALAQEMPDIGFKSIGRGQPLALYVQG